MVMSDDVMITTVYAEQATVYPVMIVRLFLACQNIMTMILVPLILDEMETVERIGRYYS